MAGEYKSACGCKIHVAQWTAKRKVVSQQSCPLHKGAAEMLAAAKALLKWKNEIGGIRDTDGSRAQLKVLERAIAESEGGTQ